MFDCKRATKTKRASPSFVFNIAPLLKLLCLEDEKTTEGGAVQCEAQADAEASCNSSPCRVQQPLCVPPDQMPSCVHISEANQIELIPDEVLLLIFSFLGNDVKNLCQAACVCRRWNDFVMRENKIWEGAFKAVPAIQWKNLQTYRERAGGLRSLVVEETCERIKMKKILCDVQAEYAKHARGNPTSSLGFKPIAMESLKIVVVGDGAVGKTCTLITYTSNLFPDCYIPTSIEDYSLTVEREGVAINLSMWDTSPDYDRLRLLAYRQADVILICFSLVSRASFVNVASKWVCEVTSHCRGTPFILAGTKLDLLSGDSDNSSSVLIHLADKGEAPISFEEATQKARMVGAAGYISYSSLTQQNLKLLFDECIKAAIRGPRTIGKRKSSSRNGGCVMN